MATMTGPLDEVTGVLNEYTYTVPDGAVSPIKEDFTTGVFESRYCGMAIIDVTNGGEIVPEDVASFTGWEACTDDYTVTVQHEFSDTGSYMLYGVMMQKTLEWDGLAWQTTQDWQPIHNDAEFVRVTSLPTNPGDVGVPPSIPEIFV